MGYLPMSSIDINLSERALISDDSAAVTYQLHSRLLPID